MGNRCVTIDHTQRRYALLLMYALAAFWGIAQVVSFDNTVLHVLISILISATATVWIVAQPGGSVRDQEVIDAANREGLAMVFTGTRHFRH